jgi:hypothetical protein
VFAYEWQGKDLRDRECVRAANNGLTRTCFCAFAHDSAEEKRPEIARERKPGEPARSGPTDERQ